MIGNKISILKLLMTLLSKLINYGLPETIWSSFIFNTHKCSKNDFKTLSKYHPRQTLKSVT